MELTRFRIKNFRNIEDSGEIAVGKTTTLLGLNESGKSSVLKALTHLNPDAKKYAILDARRNFPNFKPYSEFKLSNVYITSHWKLSPTEQKTLREKFPIVAKAKALTLSRTYGGEFSVVFDQTEQESLDFDQLIYHLRQLEPSILQLLERLAKEQKHRLASSVIHGHFKRLFGEISAMEEGQGKSEKFAQSTLNTSMLRLWTILKPLREKLPSTVLPDFEALELQADALVSSHKTLTKACQWILKQVPVFIYFNKLKWMDGRYNLLQYFQQLKEQHFQRHEFVLHQFLRVCSLDVGTFRELIIRQDFEARDRILADVNRTLSKTIQSLWKVRSLKFRLSVDGDKFNIFISEVNNSTEVETHLDRCSLGFRKYLYLYVTLSYAAMEKPSAIFVFDDPGLHQQFAGNESLPKYFAKKYHHQSICCAITRSQINDGYPEKINHVLRNEDSRSIVNPLPEALDQETPAASPQVLLVENIREWWYLLAASRSFALEQRGSLPLNLVITPLGGARNLSMSLRSLHFQKFSSILLLNPARLPPEVFQRLSKEGLLEKRQVLLFSRMFQTDAAEADIEDLFSPKAFQRLVQMAYAAELKGCTLDVPDPALPALPRMHKALTALDTPFHGDRVANFLMTQCDSQACASFFSGTTQERFSALFQAIATVSADLRQNPLTFVKQNEPPKRSPAPKKKPISEPTSISFSS